MAYTIVENLIGGVDRTRKRYVGAPGTLWAGINGHITRGGDFEKRKAFKAWRSLPAGTVGLAKDADGLRVFGIATSASIGTMPVEVTYTQLAHPTNPSMAMSRIESWDLFDGDLYVIPKYDNGDYRHFYNGSSVADWGAGGSNPSGYGSLVRTFKRKVYSPQLSLLWFSEVDVATNFDTGASGSGYVNIANHQSGSDAVSGLGVFQNQLAIFSRFVIQLWNMFDDDANNAPAQYLTETGTRSPRSVVGFGDLDAFYLADSGIRSLRARTGTNTAGVNDVGTPIDTLVQAWMASLSTTEIERAIGLVEPVDGRYWLAIGERVYVFSYFPSKKVSAWTWYEPGLTFSDMVSYNGRIYARSGDVIYLYGGDDNDEYENCTVTVQLPFLSFGKPGTYKQLTGIDVAAEGTWTAKALINPRDENEYVDLGEVDGVTFTQENTGAAGSSTHFALEFVNEEEGAATLSMSALYNTLGESEA